MRRILLYQQLFTKFTKELLDKFLQSRPSGMSKGSIEAYHYTLDKCIGHPLTPEAITQYLSSLSCRNGKLKFYSCLRALCNWLYNNGYIPDNPIKRVCVPKTSPITWLLIRQRWGYHSY
jgi:hypothetical protein